MGTPDPEARLQRAVDRWVDEGLFSAACALVAKAERECATAVSDPTISVNSLLDLASLTKLLTATLALRLHSESVLPLDRPLGELTECHRSLRELTAEDLLRHRSGLAAWLPLSACVPQGADVLDWLLRSDLCSAPLETYSDLGYVLWGRLAERLLDDSLESLLDHFVLSELDAPDLGLSPDPSRVVPCNCDNGQEVALARDLGIEIPPSAGPPLGEPQDGNARFLGGLSGHAGLFGSARGLWSFAMYWHRALGGAEPSLPRDLAFKAVESPGPHALGWARPAAWGLEDVLPRWAIGHLGFAGSSFWLDPRAETTFALLAHRTSPFSDLTPPRREFHALAAAQLAL